MAIGETFLSAFLQVLFEQMLSTGGKKFLKLIGGVDLPKTINKWKRDLTWLEARLEDAELQQFHSEPVKFWLNDLQDLAYDIEDLLDHFAIEEQRYQLKQAEEDQDDAVDDPSHHGILDNMVQTIYASGSRAAGSLSTLFNPVDQDIRDKIDDITERLQDIQEQTQSLSLTTAHMLQQQTLQTETIRRQRESASLVGKVFGRDEKKKEIITLLLNDDQSSEGYVVIPIVGTGGIGKTILAQYVYNDEQKYVYRDEQLYAYNDEQQKCNFDLKAWVCVSDVFDVKRVTIDIINSLTNSNFDCSTLDRAQVKLQEELKGKKFFIVLDDIWSEEYDDWYKLQEPFRHGAKGSRVIMTTRIEHIAMMMVNNPTQHNIITLERLPNDDCWLVFQQHAKVDSDLTDLREIIIEKIDGLPLAAKALGGLLKRIPDKRQRRNILESNVWVEKSKVLPVLRLSYYHLPSHLKRVFAYCSVLPKDYKFKEMEIIKLWMAQGFLPDNDDKRMEDIGHDYINDLVSRSLFEKHTFYGERFTMHDLIHDVAHFAAGSIRNIMDGKSTRTNLRKTRHLYITSDVQTLVNQNMASQLRTLLCHYSLKIDNFDFFEKIPYIRTLSLWSDEIGALPESIGNLKHLRYLYLEFKMIKVLPKSISKLWNLQTLCLCECYKLEEIPYIGSLERLRHLYIWRDSLKEMPHGIEKLTKLQTLRQFKLANGGGSRVREMGKLNQLRGGLMIVSGLENVTKVDDAKEAQLCKKEINGLNLTWGTCTDEVDDKTRRDVVEKLQPHTSIKEFVLDGYMGSTFPSWLGDSSFINMVHIKLKKCQNCVCLPPLGQLRSLKILLVEDMDGIEEVGLEFYGNWPTPFSSLKTLQFSRMKTWEKWVHPPIDNNNAFPSLEELSIKGCPSLQGDLPPHLPSLRRLEINGVEQLQSLELKNSSSTTSHLEEVIVEGCKSMVSIGQIPLTFPSWLGDSSFINMVDIKLKKCQNCVCLPPLGQLRSLKNLLVEDMDGIEEVGLEFYGNWPTPFSSLKTLQFSWMKTWEKWVHPPIDNNNAFPSLEELSIKGCPSLQGDLPPHLPSLRRLEINRVEQPQSLELKNSSSTTSHLEEVIVERCKSMVSIGQIPLTLKSLRINNCEKLGYVEFDEQSTNLSRGSDYEKGLRSEESIGVSSKAALELPLLTNLEIERCPSLISLQQSLLLPALRRLRLVKCENMEKLPGELHNITSLQGLVIEKCPKIHSLAEGGLPRNLTLLEIEEVNLRQAIQEWGLPIIECIPCPHLSLPSSLSKLYIYGFQNLKTISFNSSTLPNLTSLNVRDCPRLESLVSNLTSLTHLSIENLKTISFNSSTLPNITSLYVRDCPRLESLFSNLTSLTNLAIKNCPELHNFPEGGLPTNLTLVSIRGSKIDKPIKEWGLHLLTSLDFLILANVGSCVDTLESISYPDFPSSLRWLTIESFQNLKTICRSTLPRLRTINIKYCPKLESFDDDGLPPEMKFVNIKECDMIEQHLRSDPNGRMYT